MIPAIVRRDGCWWVVMHPGRESRVGYPTRKRFPEPVRTMRVVQHRACPLELPCLATPPPCLAQS
eukprot:4161444-Pyramimonas_sp.AAC.1